MTDRLTVLVIHLLGYMLCSLCYYKKILLVACYCAVQVSMGINVAGGCGLHQMLLCADGKLYCTLDKINAISNPVFNL